MTGKDSHPYENYVCETMNPDNTPQIDAPSDVTIISERGESGAYIASTVTEIDMGIEIRQ